MLRWIVGSSLRYRYLMIVLAAVLMFAGISRIRNTPVDVLPEFAPPYVEVQTEALGLSAAEVEMLVTLNIEELLNGTPWLQSIRSSSVPGLSSVILTFQPGTDVLRARQLVQERLTMATMLPNVSAPPVILQPLSATSRVMMVGLSSQEVSQIEMSVLARWDMRPALMGVPGVANVAIWGQRERQLQAQVDPERLRANGVTLDQVIRTAGDSLWVSPLSFLNASTPGTGGWIDTPQQRLGVRHVQPISVADDLAKVAVEGAPELRLGDVARVVEDHQPLIGDAILSNGPGLLLVIEKFPGTSTLEVTRGVEETLAALQPGLTGIQIDTTIFRPASFIESAIDNLGRTLLIGFLLVLLVIVVFLWQLRVALISLVAIPLSVVTAGVVLSMRGATVNAMVLAGIIIAIGVVVDDSIIDVENVRRRLSQLGTDGRNRSKVTVLLELWPETRSSIVFATLVVVLAAVPAFFVGGVSGTFFQSLAFSYVLAVLASMLVALTVTPALSLLLLSQSPTERQSPLTSWLLRGYERILARIIGTPRPLFVVAVVAVLATVAVWPIPMEQSLFPSFREPNLLIKWESAPGTSLPAMTQLVNQATDELRTVQGVRNVAGHVGRAVMGDQVVGVNAAELWISIDPAADYDATLATIQATADGYPGLARSVQTYLQERVSQVTTGSSEAVIVRLYGPEFSVLGSKAEEVRKVLSRIDGVVDLRVERQVEEPSVDIMVDLAKAEQYGIKPGDVRRAAATLLNGLQVGSLFEQQKVFEVVVWSTRETRQNLTDIRELLIDTSSGHVRLEDVADVETKPTLNVINREAVSRRIDIGFNVRGRDLGAVAREVEAALRQVEFPLEYHAELEAEYVERQAALQRLLIVGLAALIGIFLLLQATFDSWRLASLICLTWPIALMGGVWAALGTGVVSLWSFIGLLTILGMATRNGTVLISRYRQLMEHEGVAFGAGLVLRGARERMAPTLAAAVATGLALLPFVLFGSVPGLEIVQPMAVVILGGLATSTALTLFVMPALYLTVQGKVSEPGDIALAPSALASSAYKVLVAEDLRKSYGPRPALRGLTFSLEAGRVLGFLGPNGAGKTTAIRILTTILEPTSGRFLVAGISSEYPQVIRRKIGVLPESMGFPKQMTGIEYLTFYGRLYGRTASEAKTYGLALLEEVNLQDRARSLIGSYSRGMRQRLGIARALVNDPAVLFLDEPTLGLDPRGQEDLLTLVRRIARERNAGVVLCSHLLSEVESVCDDVVILNSGRIISQGSVAGVIGAAQRNTIRIHLQSKDVPAAQQVMEALPNVAKVNSLGATTDWLEVELARHNGGDLLEEENVKSGILEVLVRAGIPIHSFGADGGRLHDVFLQLTEEASE